MPNIFPPSINRLPRQLLIAGTLLAVAATGAVAYYFTPKYTRVGYAPVQPVAYNHDLHVTQLGLDCRYCHTNVDKSGHANVPAASTCMSCHNVVKADSPALALIRDSYNSGQPVDWVRVHQVPDYVYFNHAAHVNRGVSCASCHAQVNRMEVVRQSKPFSMAFCLECHREPERFVRPLDQVYNLDWQAESPEAQLRLGRDLVSRGQINPPQSCSGCHR